MVVKGSARSPLREGKLLEVGVHPFVVDISTGELGSDDFFDSETLVVNIPYKGVEEFRALVRRIEGSGISNVIFVSSTSVYGNKDGVISEKDDDCLMPCALLDIEVLFSSSSHFSTTVIRFGGLIGYSRNPAFFFKNNRLVKSPDSTVNLIHRDDCVNIISLIIKQKAWGATFNCCADSHPTKREFYTYAAEASGVQLPTFSVEGDMLNKVIGNDKVKKELGYEFIHSNLLDLKF